MTKTSSAFLIVLIPLLALCAPGRAAAAVDPSLMTDPVNSPNCQSMAAAAAANYQRKVSKINDISKLFPVLSLDSYCWNNINQMFNTAVTLTDPMKLASTIALNLLRQYSNQICSNVISLSGQLRQYSLSQLNSICIPLPTLSANLGKLNLGLTPAPRCQGIPLLQAGSITSMPYMQWSPGNFFSRGQ